MTLFLASKKLIHTYIRVCVSDTAIKRGLYVYNKLFKENAFND